MFLSQILPDGGGLTVGISCFKDGVALVSLLRIDYYAPSFFICILLFLMHKTTTSKGIYSLQLNIRVYVIVKNINDNAPVFSNNMYTMQIDEVELILYSRFKAHTSLNSVTDQCFF